jgi:2-polyprenyl-3-methyl-5-hydroxy-6-metoxy-1,4-benzoquinol methylase
MVVGEDRALCYPEGYQPHVDILYSLASIESPRRFARDRDVLRRAVMAAARNRPETGFFGRLGQLLALNRRIRLRAFYDATDGIEELLPWTGDGGRALDVGCGAGRLMIGLKRVGWRVEGIEWNPQAADLASRYTGCSVRVGDFRSLDVPANSYDLVVLHHVLEHLDSPSSALRRIAELLAPGGRAVLVYPNPRSLGATIFCERWLHWDVPRHLVIPAPSALIQEARKVGLVPWRVRSTARKAGPVLALSRADRRESIQERANCRVELGDRVLHLLEASLVAAGLAMGEELVVTLVPGVRLPLGHGDGAGR